MHIPFLRSEPHEPNDDLFLSDIVTSHEREVNALLRYVVRFSYAHKSAKNDVC